MSESAARQELAEHSKHEYTYANLCRIHFRSADPLPQFSRKEPRSPLLKTTPDEELDLIVKVWRMIYRFMTDSSDSRQNSKPSNKSRRQKRSNLPVMPRLRQEIIKMSGQGETKASHMTGSDVGRGQGETSATSVESSESGSKRFKHSLKKRLSHSSTDQRQLEEEVINIEETIQTAFDQMQFIIGVGILIITLRDEIYCQILKQLTNNTIKTARSRLWMLLDLLIGIFPPSDTILPYVDNFIDDGPTGQSGSMKQLLTRVRQNGPRFQPPSTDEYKAVLNKQPLVLQVTLMNGTSHSISSDSCTMSAEVIRAVASDLELEEMFGFSLFITMGNKISSLGCTGDKVFDSISQCEQVYHSNPSNGESEDAPWRLFIRKEMFSPWDDVSTSSTSTNLVYSQIVRGIMLGEYVCDRDGDLAAVAAMQYYVDYECDVSEDNLYSSLPYYVPSHKLTGEDSLRVWCKQVSKFLNKMIVVYAKSDENYERSTEAVKAELVTWAKRKWPKAFSRYFDVKRLEGPRWNTDSLILGVNSRGISITTVTGDIGMDATYPQISSVMGERDEPGLKSFSGSIIIFVFANGTLMKFDSADAADIYRLITSNMTGLLERSTWAVAKQEFQDPTDTFLSCIEGDLIQLQNPAKDEAMTSSQCECINIATKDEGKMQTSLLHILPCVEEPTDDILRLFRSPNYYAKRATDKINQNLETSVEVYNQIDEGCSEKMETRDYEDETGMGLQEAPVNSEYSNPDEVIAISHVQDQSGGLGEDVSKEIDDRKDQEQNIDVETYNDSESSNIGFDKDFYNALSLFQKGIDEGEDQKADGEVFTSYA